MKGGIEILRIDGHTHVEGSFTEKEKLNKSLDELFKQMDKLSIDKAMIMPNSFQQSNEMISELCNIYKDKLFGFCWAEFDDKNPLNHIRRLHYCIEKLGFKGLKIHPRYHGVSISDQRVEDLIKIAGDLTIPVYFDCLPSKGKVPVKETIPLLIDELAMKYPKTKIVIAHMGGHYALDSYAVVRNNDNVYLDLSNTIIRYQGSTVIKDIEFVIKELAPKKKLIYGTDYPTYSMIETYRIYNDMFSRLDISTEDRDYIMGSTLERLIN